MEYLSQIVTIGFFLFLSKNSVQSSIGLLNIDIRLAKFSDTQQIEFKLNGPLSNQFYIIFLK